MNFPTITRNNWMCCSIILVFLALGSPEPLVENALLHGLCKRKKIRKKE